MTQTACESTGFQKVITPKNVKGDLENGEKFIIFVQRKEGKRSLASPLFSIVDYQSLTRSKSVHAGARGCTSPRDSPHSGRYGVGLRFQKVPFSVSAALFQLLELIIFLKNLHGGEIKKPPFLRPSLPCSGAIYAHPHHKAKQVITVKARRYSHDTTA